MRRERLTRLAAEVASRPARLGRTRLVCVDGPSGAGKTVFAGHLAEALSPPAPVVHTDDLLDGWDDQFTFWERLERRVLAPLRAGRAGGYRAYDWHRGEFGGPSITVPAAPVVIVEGVSAARARARAEASLTVFVTAPLRLRLARSARRDGEELRPYLEKWRKAEEHHFAVDATVANVDLIIDTDDSGVQRWRPADPPRGNRQPEAVDGRARLRHDRSDGPDGVKGGRPQ